jgi:hypothetical protein
MNKQFNLTPPEKKKEKVPLQIKREDIKSNRLMVRVMHPPEQPVLESQK